MDQHTGLTSTHYIEPLLDLLAEQGFSKAEILDGSGCTEQSLKQPKQFINLVQLDRITSNAKQLSHDSYLGLQLGGRLNVSAHGALGTAVLTAENPWQSVQVAIKYFSLTTSLVSVKLIKKGNRATIELSAASNLSTDMEGFTIQTLLGSIDVMISFLVGDSSKAHYLHLKYPKNVAFQRYTKRDISQIHFNQAHNFIDFPVSALQKPLPLADSAAHQRALLDCDEEIKQLAKLNSFSGQIYQQLMLCKIAIPDIEEVSAGLSMSSRTLRRRLKEENSNYRDLVSQVRIHKAKKLLSEDNLSVTEVAYELSYTDSANFSRAFKRATGATPTEFLTHHNNEK